ncbi:MAG: hypothetical protein K2J08_09675 [Ruminococcus sp.]|nr:hypothetical protein [Ruminococcus sp.]
MLGTIKKIKEKVTDRTVYMEVYGGNKTAYRVISGRVGGQVVYGVEAEDYNTGEREEIPDFSPDVRDAVKFSEMLIRSRTSPKNIYIKALEYLRMSI